jgi:integrase
MAVRKRTWTTSSGERRDAWICQYIDNDGIDRIKTFATKTAAKDFAATTHTSVRRGVHVPDAKSETVKQAAEAWIDAVRVGRSNRDRGPAEASTLRQYRYHLDTYILRELGREKLNKLTKARVLGFRDHLIKTVSRPLARKVLTSLKGLLNEAVDREKLAVNPAARVKVGGNGNGEAEEVIIPSKADIAQILTTLDGLAAHPDKWRSKAWRRRRVMVQTAIHTGIRASELRGLPWDAIDLKTHKLTVMQKADERGEVKRKTKSKAGKREISLPAGLTQLLRQWKLEMGKDEGLVFPTGEGKPESHANIYNRCWKPLLLAAGIADPKKDDKGKTMRDGEGKPIMEPRYNWHALRHFHASMLIDNAANAKEVQEEMGHSSIQVTYDLYGHLFRDEAADQRRKERADRMAAAIG